MNIGFEYHDVEYSFRYLKDDKIERYREPQITRTIFPVYIQYMRFRKEYYSVTITWLGYTIGIKLKFKPKLNGISTDSKASDGEQNSITTR